MGISLSSNRGPRAQLNVTPLVDVVLVMLIVFLVAAPVMLKSHEVEVPARDDGGAAELGPIEVAVHGDGSVSIEADGHASTVMLVDLATAARPLLDAHPGRPILLDVEDQLPYQIAVETIDTLRSAGGGRVALARR